MNRRFLLILLVAWAGWLGVRPAAGDEARILADIKAFFATTDADEREALAQRIEADEAFSREKMSGWLHAAVPFEDLSPGQRTIHVEIGPGQTRDVVLRIPPGYDPHRAWPLIYALHGAGGRGEHIIAYVEHVLGDKVDEYVIAAPTNYREHIIHSVQCVVEHPVLLHAVKKAVNVDSNCVFLLGYSLGGHTAWTAGVLYADQFAGVVPLAGTFHLFEVDGLWDQFLPNLAHTPVLCAWGAGDVHGPDGQTVSPQGGIAGLNRQVCELARKLSLPVIGHEYPDRGHGDVDPPPEEFAKLLAHRREAAPREVAHRFRDIRQGRTFWLEGHVWTGPQWTDKLPTVRLREGEDPNKPDDVRAALLRTARALLAELRGTIDGQKVNVHRKGVRELTIWFTEGMIDWSQPVTVRVSGRDVFEGELHPDVFVCLAQAARTRDFDCLRWAGLRFRSGSRTRPVTGRTEFPEPSPPKP
ncbi:MAG: hypothetical protein PVJ57_21410 [Phycisphaerae bacterium]|jgi:dienelactone hydrolase